MDQSTTNTSSLCTATSQVVFGHCISNCGGTGSNINAAQATQVTSDLKNYNHGEFACNGGAFFWVAVDDIGGAWSDAVLAEVRETAGCSKFGGPSTTSTSSTTTTTTGSNYSAEHGEDSRLIAYVGNWQTCPTTKQVGAYSHLVIAYAVSYT